MSAPLALSFHTGTVWTMCSSRDAPLPLFNTCNGENCDRFGLRGQKLPAMWSEEWSATAWQWTWGTSLPRRSAEDMAFRQSFHWAKGGCHQNYYMWYGGTTYGRLITYDNSYHNSYHIPACYLKPVDRLILLLYLNNAVVTYRCLHCHNEIDFV